MSDFTYNKELYIIDDCWSKWEKGTLVRRYTGNFIICDQNFFPDGTMNFEFFDKANERRISTFNRAEMNEISNLMLLISKNKDKLYPKGF